MTTSHHRLVVRLGGAALGLLVAGCASNAVPSAPIVPPTPTAAVSASPVSTGLSGPLSPTALREALRASGFSCTDRADGWDCVGRDASAGSRYEAAVVVGATDIMTFSITTTTTGSLTIPDSAFAYLGGILKLVTGDQAGPSWLRTNLAVAGTASRFGDYVVSVINAGVVVGRRTAAVHGELLLGPAGLSSALQSIGLTCAVGTTDATLPGLAAIECAGSLHARFLAGEDNRIHRLTIDSGGDRTSLAAAIRPLLAMLLVPDDAALVMTFVTGTAPSSTLGSYDLSVAAARGRTTLELRSQN